MTRNLGALVGGAMASHHHHYHHQRIHMDHHHGYCNYSFLLFYVGHDDYYCCQLVQLVTIIIID